MPNATPRAGAPLDVCIDVSHAQGIIEWDSVAKAGIKVAMVKATQGQGYTDPRWIDNLAGAIAAGIRVIPYHFINSDSPAAQALNFVQHCEPGKAYALDWEGHNTLSPADVERLGAILFARLGRDPLGYWGIPGASPGTPATSMITWPRWVPRYRFGRVVSFPAGSTETVGVDCLFWQYSSNGQVPGIRGSVDRSVAMFGSVEELLTWCDAPPSQAERAA